MRSGSGEIRKVGAPEGSKVMIGRVSAIECEEWSAHVQRFGGEAIYEVGGSSKCIGPVGGGHGCLESRVRLTLLVVRSMSSALPFCCEV